MHHVQRPNARVDLYQVLHRGPSGDFLILQPEYTDSWTKKGPAPKLGQIPGLKFENPFGAPEKGTPRMYANLNQIVACRAVLSIVNPLHLILRALL